MSEIYRIKSAEELLKNSEAAFAVDGSVLNQWLHWFEDTQLEKLLGGDLTQYWADLPKPKSIRGKRVVRNFSKTYEAFAKSVELAGYTVEELDDPKAGIRVLQVTKEESP